MMKALTSFFLCCALPAAAQQAVNFDTATSAHFEGWGSFTIPLPAGYNMAGIRSGEGVYTFRIVQSGGGEITKPPTAAETLMEICSCMTPPPAPEGSEVTATVAGEKVTGTYTAGSNGKGGSTSFLITKGVEGACLAISVPDSPHREVMLTMLEKLQADEAPKTEPQSNTAADTAPDMSAAEAQTFRCYGSITLPVPPGAQVIPQEGVESYLLHVYGPDKKQGMTIYSGYTPSVSEESGRPCPAVIAGESVQGKQLKDRREYVLERGTQGAVLHIVVFNGDSQALMHAMLQGMVVQAPPSMPEDAKAQARAVFTETVGITAAVNKLFAGVKDAKSAAAAVPDLRVQLQALQKLEAASESLSRKYGRAAAAYISTLSPAPSVKDSSIDEHIQRVHDADCYGCEELQEVLEDFMGL